VRHHLFDEAKPGEVLQIKKAAGKTKKGYFPATDVWAPFHPSSLQPTQKEKQHMQQGLHAAPAEQKRADQHAVHGSKSSLSGTRN